MTIVGYNVQVDGVQFNTALITEPPFTFDGLPSGSDLGITITTVDAAGLESAPSEVFPASTSGTIPDGGPLSLEDRNAVDAIVAASMAESTQPGVIVSITGPRGYYAKAYGNTAATGGRPLTTDDHFRMGSTSKTFTTTAFWMAVDQGLVSLDDTVDNFVSGVPQGNAITMRHLLSMRSGVYDYQANALVMIIFSLFPTFTFSEAGALQIIRGNPSQFTPGTKYAYTDSNYFILGAVLSAVDPAGRKIKQIITDDVITPLGLTETKWPASAVVPAPAASASQVNPELFGSSGALTSTVGDLIKWSQAMRDGTLISLESWNTWTSTHIPYASGFDRPAMFSYGYGMEGLGTWYGHNGSVPGFSTSCTFDMVSGACIAVSENKQTTSPVTLAAFSTIFRKIGDYLYPDSMAEQNYTGTTIRPASAVVSITGGVPNVSVTVEGAIIPDPAVVTVTGGTPTVTVVHNKLITPASAVVTITGGIPGASPIAVRPDSAMVSVTGGTPAVIVKSFTPFSEENVNRIDRLVPAGTTGCWVTLLGAGASGVTGPAVAASASGGNGGGGGAKIGRSFIPVASLGSTYSLTRGTTPGSSTTFTSGGVTATAGGGTGRTGGAVTQTGVSLTAIAGSTGGTGGSLGASNTGGAGSGGGGGCNKSGTVWASEPGSGGSTTGGGTRGVGNGAAGGTGGPGMGGGGGAGGGTGSGGAGIAYPGGPGGTYGAGGGGGAATNPIGATGGRGGAGAAGYALIEWVDT